MAVKIAEALEVSLDYLIGRSENDFKDKKMIDRLNSILNLDKQDKDNIVYNLDNLIKLLSSNTVKEKAACWGLSVSI